MAVRRGLFVQPTAGGVGTTPVDARVNLAGLLTPNGALGAVPGVLSGLTVTGVASGWAYQVTAGHAVTTRGATDGAILLSVDGNTNTPAPVIAGGGAGSTSAPVSGSRYELIWILQRDLDAAEADNIAALGVTQGTASGSPVRPAVPTGALVIAEALVPTGAANTAAGSVTITSVAAKVGLRGGLVAVANTTQRDLLNTYATATSPVYVDRLDTGALERSVASGTWTTLAITPTSGVWNLASGLSVATNTYTVVPATSVVETPTPGKFSNSSGAITVTDAGVYEVDVAIRWPGTATAPLKRYIGVAVNCASITWATGALSGGTMLAAEVAAPTGTADFTQRFHSRRFTLAAGDVLRVFVAQDSGTTLVVNPGLNDALGYCALGVHRVA